MKKAIVFDLDGTLLNTLTDIANAVNAALWENGLPYRSVSEIERFVGDGAKTLIARCVEDADDKAEDVLADFRRIYDADCDNQTRPYSGILSLLKRLRADGLMIGVVSNKPDPAVKNLCAHYFAGMTEFAVGNADGRKVKPDPGLLVAELAGLGVSPKEAVYVGDGEADVACARNAGTDFVGVGWGFRSEEELKAAGADVVVCCPEEAYVKISELCNREEE